MESITLHSKGTSLKEVSRNLERQINYHAQKGWRPEGNLSIDIQHRTSVTLIRLSQLISHE